MTALERKAFEFNAGKEYNSQNLRPQTAQEASSTRQNSNRESNLSNYQKRQKEMKSNFMDLPDYGVQKKQKTSFLEKD